MPGVNLKKGEFVLVDISDCCERHDAAYKDATFEGLFSDKPKADCELRDCIKETFKKAIEGVGGTIIGEGFGDIYWLGVAVGGNIPWILESIR